MDNLPSPNEAPANVETVGALQLCYTTRYSFTTAYAGGRTAHRNRAHCGQIATSLCFVKYLPEHKRWQAGMEKVTSKPEDAYPE